MAKPLKEAGMVELETFHRRVRRQFALGRISALDFTVLERKVFDLKKYVNEMKEEGCGEASSNTISR